MEIKVDVSTKGLDEITGLLPFVDKAIRKIAFDALARAIKAIKTGPKTGRAYRSGSVARNYKTGGKRAAQLKAIGLRGKANQETGKTRFTLGAKLHRASAPGQAPASDKGILAASGFVKRVAKAVFRVGFSAKYAPILEEEMDRPFLGPAMRGVEAELQNAVKTIFEGAGES